MTVPLLYLMIWKKDVSNPLFDVYFVATSLTHFFITFALYADAKHSQFFKSTPRNRFLFFVAPVAIFGFVFLIGSLRVDPAHGYEPRGDNLGAMFWAFWWLAAVTAIDFSHSTRQTFGVLQMIKVQPGLKFPSWTKHADRFFFLSVAVTQLATFLTAGRFDPTNPWTQVLLAFNATLGAAVLFGFVRAWILSTQRRGMLIPFTYFLFQTISAAFVVWRFELYFIALAMHNVEYHVLMVPRLMTRRAERTATKRWAGWKYVAVTYGLVLVASLYYCVQSLLPPDLSQQQWVWTAACLFNGVFLTHYFLERMLWKFSDPSLRAILGPLYFAPPPAKAAA